MEYRIKNIKTSTNKPLGKMKASPVPEEVMTDSPLGSPKGRIPRLVTTFSLPYGK